MGVRIDSAIGWLVDESTNKVVGYTDDNGKQYDLGGIPVPAGTTPSPPSFSAGAASWGQIIGVVSDQSDLQSILAAKAPTANPTFSGTVSGVTKSHVGLGNVDNQSVATTLASSALTGVPTAPTAAPGTNTTQLATTAFVTAAITTIPDGDKGDISIAAGVWTIDAGTVTNAKLANMAANSIKGNNTGGSAVALDLTTAQVKTLLAIAVTDVSGAAPTASPTFTGTVVIPTPAAADSSTKAASTAFVQGEISPLLKVSAAAPSGGSDGQWQMRGDPPYLAAIYKKVAGVWTAQNNNYTWAARPSASGNSGAVITVTDWGQDFVSDGTNWIPVNKILQFVQSAAAGTITAGTGATVTLVTDTIPAGLVIAGCRIDVEALWNFVGATATKQCIVDINGVSLSTITSNAAANLSMSTAGFMYVENATNLIRTPITSTSTDDHYNNSNSALPTSAGLDFTASKSLQWRMNANAADTVQLCARRMVISYL